ncbi:Dymeclin [Cokeromyces recurvatus]|uniref:Dymeclin n=1 Tax=Cokeromyces recurvatus TaxID=90255 RepID=UPI00221E8DB0|nr:Dymeclin [Cokeromyces recurvatus]KAI7898688.1 Dymeclin [Cokeromyces recurvatus]
MDPSVNYSTYEFYTEILNTFLVLFSTQLRQSNLKQQLNYFLNILLTKFGKRAETMVARLLENIIEQRPPPPQSSSVMHTAYNYFFAARANTSYVDASPVADRSLLILLLLGSQPAKNDNSEWTKSYRLAIANLSDHHVISSDIDGCDRKMHLISFKNLFQIFSKSLHSEEKMLLFYLILVENEAFRVYVLSRIDQETIFLPMLKLIYESMEAGKTRYSQVYILMVIILILSQDDVNNEAIQKIIVHNTTWFTERPLLKSISLGGLMTLVLIRVLQLNLSHQKDIYLHTTSLAILMNMSNTMSDMHANVAQRFISLFELLARRYIKLTEKQTMPDAIVYEDILVLLLEIINSTLSHRLKHNSQLVYALLQKREIFNPFQNHPRFSDLVTNLEQIIYHFNTRVSEANLRAPSSNEVLKLIEQASRTWSNQKLISLQTLKFHYKEEQDSYEFFIPYIWALVQRRSFIYWSEEKCHIIDNYHLMNEETE